MADFNSYEPLLRKYMELVKPKLVLEYGTGKSTGIIASYPNVNVISMEHDAYYFKIFWQKYREIPNIKIVHANYKQGYVEFPLGLNKKFDLIFVDGLCDARVECLNVAKCLLAENGVVILHDSERKKYDAGRTDYLTVEEQDGTAVLIPK